MKLFTIRGTPQQIDYARQLIEEKIGVSSGKQLFVNVFVVQTPG